MAKQVLYNRKMRRIVRVYPNTDAGRISAFKEADSSNLSNLKGYTHRPEGWVVFYFYNK